MRTTSRYGFILMRTCAAAAFVAMPMATVMAEQTAQDSNAALQSMMCAPLVSAYKTVKWWGDPDFRVYDEVGGDGTTVALGITKTKSYRFNQTAFSAEFTGVSDQVNYRLEHIRSPFDTHPTYQTSIPVGLVAASEMMAPLDDPDGKKVAKESEQETFARVRDELIGPGGATQFCYTGLKLSGDNVIITERCGLFLDRLWSDETSMSANTVDVVPKREIGTSILSTSLKLISQVQQRWQACTKSVTPQ